jgi:hypothetical protein
MTDAETAAAIAALTHRVQVRDQAIRDGEDYPDAGPFAQEFITAMSGYGWRHVEALAPPKPAPAATSAPSKREELLAPVRAQLDALNAAQKAEREALGGVA